MASPEVDFPGVYFLASTAFAFHRAEIVALKRPDGGTISGHEIPDPYDRHILYAGYGPATYRAQGQAPHCGKRHRPPCRRRVSGSETASRRPPDPCWADIS